MAPLVGIIANPVSASDIRRVVANASTLQVTDRANIVLRVLSALASCGITNVLMMPEKSGIRRHITRAYERAANLKEDIFPQLDHIRMDITSTVEDTLLATRKMREAGCVAIVVLGGDGTHRAVVSQCGDIPISGISTGTNNAFPEHREPTITGLATGLAVSGKIPANVAFQSNKRIDIGIGEAVRDIAIVDVAIVTERFVGAKALWKPENFRELYVTFSDPEVIGMSAIAGLLEPVNRDDPDGLAVKIVPIHEARTILKVPFAPGIIGPIGIGSWRRLKAGVPAKLDLPAGTIALDGERELAFDQSDDVSISLVNNAFRTINVSAVMQYASRNGLMRTSSAITGPGR
ncbi:MAG: ATP-NAD kinase family protein [Hyphomicrobiales bacterium]